MFVFLKKGDLQGDLPLQGGPSTASSSTVQHADCCQQSAIGHQVVALQWFICHGGCVVSLQPISDRSTLVAVPVRDMGAKFLYKRVL